jgi:hypothetical protein
MRRPGHRSVITPDDGNGVGMGGSVTIAAGDKAVAEGRVERTAPFRFSAEETLDVGVDTGMPAGMSHDVPAVHKGELGKIVIDLMQATGKGRRRLASCPAAPCLVRVPHGE